MATKKFKLLLVDKNLKTRAMVRATLENEFEIEETGSGTEAWQKFEASPADMVLAEYAIDNLNGIDLLAKVAAARPKTVRFLMSDGAGDLSELMTRASEQGKVHFFFPQPLYMDFLKKQFLRC